MKKLIFKKLFKDILVFFAVMSLSLTVIVWVIQAVNFLDFVSEDGHSFRVYFSYTFLNFPKIFSRIFLITFFIANIYIITKYEENNELILFWTMGISKNEFIKNIVKFSIFFMLIQILFSSLISPKSLDTARSYIRNSNIDLFPSLIREKQFVDTVSNLTIYVDKINNNKTKMQNIFIKDERDANYTYQLILAKEGELVNINDKNLFILKNGEVFNRNKNNSSSFKFENFEFNLSDITTKTTTIPKLQETASKDLIKCYLNIKNNKKYIIEQSKLNCDIESLKNLNEELLKRFYLPLFLPIISLISCLIILSNKEEKSFGNYKVKIFIFGFAIIFFSESSIKYVGTSLINNSLIFIFPLLIYLFIYLFILRKLKYKIKIIND